MSAIEELLARVHKQIGEVAGEIAIALVQRRVTGGRSTMMRWSAQLKRAVTTLDEKIDPNTRAEHVHGDKTTDR